MNRNIRVIKSGNNRQAVLYDTALNELAYGRPAMIGDLFGDVMSAVVGKSNWDARPDWMKNIKIKPNPAAIIKAVPPQYVGKVASTAQQYGINTYYKTPYGDMQVTPDMLQSAYSNFPAFSRTMQGLSDIPTWAYVAGGLGLVLFLFAAKKK